VDEHGSRRMVISRTQQRDVQVGFRIKQVYDISEKTSTAGIKFDMIVQVSCRVVDTHLSPL
jgi:hypothetical protein